MGKPDINKDSDEVAKIVGISIENISGNFSPEWLSCQFIDSVITGVNSQISGWNQAKEVANSYNSDTEDISNQDVPELFEATDSSSSPLYSQYSDEDLIAEKQRVLQLMKDNPDDSDYRYSYLEIDKELHDREVQRTKVDSKQIAAAKEQMREDQKQQQQERIEEKEWQEKVAAAKEQMREDQKQQQQERLSTKYVVNTNNKGLNLRTGKGTDTSIITSAAKGSTVTVIDPDDGSGWTKVRLDNGKEGYVSTKWIKQKYPNSTSTSTANDLSGTSSMTAKVSTKNQGLNLRTGKGTDTSIITSAAKGSTVKVITPDDGSGWTKVRLDNGKEGYVSSKYLSNYDNK